jgi:hypothetical protein
MARINRTVRRRQKQAELCEWGRKNTPNSCSCGSTTCRVKGMRLLCCGCGEVVATYEDLKCDRYRVAKEKRQQQTEKKKKDGIGGWLRKIIKK